MKAIRSATTATITAEDAARVLWCKAHSIRVAARTRPDLLGFPVNVMGHRVRIPRKPFLQYLWEKSDE